MRSYFNVAMPILNLSTFQTYSHAFKHYIYDNLFHSIFTDTKFVTALVVSFFLFNLVLNAICVSFAETFSHGVKLWFLWKPADFHFCFQANDYGGQLTAIITFLHTRLQK